MKYICPLIVVSDINKARKFYEDILKQKVKIDFGENITFEGDFALHLKSHYKDLVNCPEEEILLKSHNGELYFESDSIEEDYERIKRTGTEFLHGLREQPWRQYVTRFYDPDGHIVEVGESIQALVSRLKKEGMDKEGISAATSLPLVFVETLYREL